MALALPSVVVKWFGYRGGKPVEINTAHQARHFCIILSYHHRDTIEIDQPLFKGTVLRNGG
jgi:hypothetical protein